MAFKKNPTYYFLQLQLISPLLITKIIKFNMIFHISDTTRNKKNLVNFLFLYENIKGSISVGYNAFESHFLFKTSDKGLLNTN